MGLHDATDGRDRGQRAEFTRRILADVDRLEKLIEGGGIESGVRRIGAEQEMFLVDRSMEPAPIAQQVLDDLADPRLTTELARFNLEANLTPRLLSGHCLRDLAEEIAGAVSAVREAARAHDANVVLAGILPTMRRRHAVLDNMTPAPRYAALNRAMCQERGGKFLIHIRGVDELEISHDNVMLESCNTSFQVHLQVAAEEFAELYNCAQIITAPLLAASVNSPVFLRRRLWSETRVALFERSVDDRSATEHERGHRPRVHFGDRWLDDSVLELLRDDIARFRILLNDCAHPADTDGSGPPPLTALRLHNGTVYRWNRPCYGIADGVAHLRIENRVLPAGPTIADEMANAAFFFGSVLAMAEESRSAAERMHFDVAKSNFFAAARHGLGAHLTWDDQREWPAADLILEELLPRARSGLQAAEVAATDIDHYLGLFEERVRSGRTGARWIVDSLSAMPNVSPDLRHRSLVAAMLDRQQSGLPVHHWPLARIRDEDDNWRDTFRTVGQVMSTDLFTVRPDDAIDLAASVMAWEHVRHVPVENDAGELVGLVSYWSLIRLVASGQHKGATPTSVESLMRRDPVTVTSGTATITAIALMQEHRVSCLPVVSDGHLVGILTERDLVVISRRLLQHYLE